MRKNIPCFIPTMVTIVMLCFLATVTMSVGLTQAYMTHNGGEEEIVSDTAEDHIQETVDNKEEEIETAVVDIVEPEPVETTEIVEVIETVTYYDVPLSEDLQDHIFKLCDERGIDPKIIISMIKVESNYNAANVGDSGNSLGLMQIQPRWHSWRLADLGCSDWFNAFDNVTVGIDIFADLYDHSGSLEWALMAYNGGSSYANARTAEGVVTEYVHKVIGHSGSLSTYESEV